jgi:DNA-binding transcriptional ArsR family regulator
MSRSRICSHSYSRPPPHNKKYIKTGKAKGGILSMSFGDTFKALSDPTRREILNLLKQGSMTAGQIVEHFDTTGATISHHLNILRQAGLIEDRKSGKYIYYELNTTVFQEVLSWMHSLMEEDKHEKK